MKNRIILSVVVIVIGLAGIAAFAYFSSQHKVSVSFSKEVTGATIFTEKGDEVKKLSSAGDVSLQNGDYYVVPDGQKVSKEKIEFSIKDKDQTLSLDPDYSIEYLATTYVNEQPAITNAATTAFPLITQGYDMTGGTLYHYGEWFGAIVVPKVSDPRDQPDYYRILLHKQNNTWKVVNSPVFVLTKSEFKDVPASVLQAVNQLTQ